MLVRWSFTREYGWKTYERIWLPSQFLSVSQFSPARFRFSLHVSVFDLGSFRLARHDDICWDVCDTNRRVRRIDVLTPAPLARYVSTLISSVRISISISSLNSGMTSQETKEVCLRPDESNGEIRTKRWTPFLLLSNRKRYVL